MAKRKIGVSLLAMFAMVLMFSISAMAAGVTGLKANVENNTLRASWASLGDASLYKVTVTDITDAAAPVVLVTDSVVNGPETSFSIAVTESTKYSVKVTSDSVLSPDAVTVEVWAPASNSALATDGETADNNIGNANQTGTGASDEDGLKAIGPDGVIKSGGMVKNNGTKGTHRTHGEYQNNTNSCASCHQTHTGASKSLLFKDGVYNTCTACHDGTLGMYNVFEHSNAGTFGGTTAGNMSVHLADGSVQVKAAPGGNLSANSGAWVNEFNCASCHSPHGSYSDRLLHYNPNNMGVQAPADGGIGIKNGKIYTLATLPAHSDNGNGLVPTVGKNILVKGVASDFGLDTSDAIAPESKVIIGYKLKLGKYGGANSWVKDDTPWLYGYDYKSPNKNYYTRFWVTEANNEPASPDLTIKTEADGTKHYQGVVDNHDQDWNSNLHFVWSKGYVYTSATDTILDNLTKGNIARAYTVDLDLQVIGKFGDINGVDIYTSNVNALYDKNTYPAFEGQGIKMSAYCASCHTDYLALSAGTRKSGGDPNWDTGTGTFSEAYRHTTDDNSYTCVRCHYAHGTDVTVMMDANGESLTTLTATDAPYDGDEAGAKEYLLDQNPSSALKRYTNMSVCWGCHTDSKAEQLKNTSSYDKSEDPHGLGDQPAMPGTLTDINDSTPGTTVIGD